MGHSFERTTVCSRCQCHREFIGSDCVCVAVQSGQQQQSAISSHRSDELRVLIATDVLSEGQNLQDAAIIVNYDLPWAIIRLVQRAGRVDRIGQKADEILCYSFLPAEGVERIIRLRSRVRQRLKENQEVVGTDEAFFEDDGTMPRHGSLPRKSRHSGRRRRYRGRSRVLRLPDLEKRHRPRPCACRRPIPELPPVVFSTRSHKPTPSKPPACLVYVRTHEGNDALAWVDTDGKPVTESQFEILKAAECTPEHRACRVRTNHHQLVESAVKLIVDEEKTVGGQLGRPSGARFRTYERLKQYAERVKGSLFDTPRARESRSKKSTAIRSANPPPTRSIVSSAAESPMRNWPNWSSLFMTRTGSVSTATRTKFRSRS